MARNTTGKPILLIYDGHRSHETIELREAADTAGIHLFCIPPHTSHRLQPLDVGVFGPLQRVWQKRCLRFLEETGQGISRQNVVKEYMAARTESMKEETILSAWTKSGIRPLNPQVFTEEDFAPSYASSINPPLPVPFLDLADGPGALGLGSGEVEPGDVDLGSQGVENVDDMSGLNVAGPSSTLNQAPHPAISSLPLLAQSTTSPTQPHETSLIRSEEGREPPNQPGADEHNQCMRLHSTPLPTVNAPRRQTRSASRSASCSASLSSAQSAPSEREKLLEAQLSDARKRILELEDSSGEWRTHSHFLRDLVVQLQGQLQSKEKRKGTHAKRTQVEARVLTSEEGRLELQQLREEARQKEQRQNEDAARKASEDDARRKRRADISRVFSGSLNKSRKKEDLEDIAVALALPEGGKKDELLERITNHFDEHPDLKTTPRFEGLFNPHPRKRARVTDIPSEGPSTVHEPIVPPPNFPPLPADEPLVANEFHGTNDFSSNFTARYYHFLPPP